MVNYYKLFEEFKKQQKTKKNIPLETFEKQLKLFFGFGGRNKTLTRWLSNFQEVGLINIEKDKNTEQCFVTIL